MGATSVQTRAVSSDASEDPAKHVLSWRSTNTQRSSRAREKEGVKRGFATDETRRARNADS